MCLFRGLRFEDADSMVCPLSVPGFGFGPAMNSECRGGQSALVGVAARRRGGARSANFEFLMRRPWGRPAVKRSLHLPEH